MHYRSHIKKLNFSKIAIAEDQGEMGDIVHFDHQEGQIYFQVMDKEDCEVRI